MQFRKAIIWSLVNEAKAIHQSLTPEEKKVTGVLPIVEALFPGINYFSISGFNQVLLACAIPALKKLYSELETASEESVSPDEMVEVSPLLPSEGYEWQNSSEWKSRFETLLAA